MTVDVVRPAALLDANGNARLEPAELGSALAQAIQSSAPISVDALDTAVESAWSRASQADRAAVVAARDALQENLAAQEKGEKKVDLLLKVAQGGIAASVAGIFVGLLAGPAGLVVVCAGLAAMLIGAFAGRAQDDALDRVKSEEPEARRALQAAVTTLVTQARQARQTAHVQP